MGNFRGWEWIIILGLALLLFGGFKKMPDAARGLGRSLRIFKAETKGLSDTDAEAGAAATAAGTPATPSATTSKPSDPPSIDGPAKAELGAEPGTTPLVDSSDGVHEQTPTGTAKAGPA